MNWMVGMMFLSIFYAAQYFSLLTWPEYERPIDTLADIVQALSTKTHYALTLKDSSFMQKVLTLSTAEMPFSILQKHLKK